MAISRKPKASEKQAQERSISALINKGGSGARNSSDKNLTEKSILLRIPAATLEMIDEVVNAKKIKTPRHTWLLEAVFEKLEKDRKIL